MPRRLAVGLPHGLALARVVGCIVRLTGTRCVKASSVMTVNRMIIVHPPPSFRWRGVLQPVNEAVVSGQHRVAASHVLEGTRVHVTPKMPAWCVQVRKSGPPTSSQSVEIERRRNPTSMEHSI